MGRWDSSDDDQVDKTNKIVKKKQKHEKPPSPSSSPLSLDASQLINLSLLYGCRSVSEYLRLGKIEEGTYGVVFKAREKHTNVIVALKEIKMNMENIKQGFPITALRETNLLFSLCHPNIITVYEMVMRQHEDIERCQIYMVMEYCEFDMKMILNKKKEEGFLQSEIKNLLQQLLQGVAYMHENWVLHRDLKTSNLLYQKGGNLKICDYGMARMFESPLIEYTQLVVTLWYRSPELLLGCKKYSTAVDMWSVGCIFAEFILRKPFFPGEGEINQLNLMFNVLGSPNEERWPGYSELPNAANIKWRAPPVSKLREQFPISSTFSGASSILSNAGFDLLQQMLSLDPAARISAADALQHPYFMEDPAPKPNSEMPHF